MSQPTPATGLLIDTTALNPIHFINNASAVSHVSVKGTVGADAVGGTLHGEIFDGQITPTAVAFASSAIVAAGSINVSNIDASSLHDGPLTIRGYVQTIGSIRSAWSPAVPVSSDTKDTAIPSSPVVSTPAAAATTNATSFTITGTNEAGATVHAYANSESATPIETSTSNPTPTTFSLVVRLTHTNGVDTANNLVVKAVDTAGNVSVTAAAVPTITQDSTNPADVTGLLFQSAATGKVTLSWTNSISADVDHYSIFTDNRTGIMSNTALATVTPGASTTSFTTDVLANGTYMFGVIAVDKAGNNSTPGSVVSNVVVNGPKVQSAPIAPGTTADFTATTPPLPISFTPAAGTTGSSTFTIINDGSILPNGSVPTGFSFLGQYFELTDSVTPSTANPVLVKFYYTQAQLDAAHVSERQLQGIYYYDSASGSWKLYGNTGVNTTDVTINGVAYAGYVYANADHFTPIAIGADTAAPIKPTNTTATAGDHQLNLSWTAVSDATSYVIRWRPKTAVDSTGYTTKTLSGSASTSTAVTGLNAGWEYEIGVATVDAVGNMSDFAVVVATTNAAVATTTSSTSTPVITTAFATTSSPVSEAPSSQSSTVAPSTTETPTPASTPETSTSSNANQNRALVIALILVIAAGAGAAGYYGYQWWAERPATVSTPAQPAPKAPTAPTAAPKSNGGKKKPSNGGRW